MTARYLVADVFDGLATLQDGSVDLVITSPPFLALRSYLPADHPDKGKEIGSEPTPAAFIDVMLAVTAELRRVLAPHGSICVELGDTYAGSAFGFVETDGNKPAKHDRPVHAMPRVNKIDGWPMPKSKALIPELYRLALAYGINPLTGQPSPAGRWRVRNTVTWCRPNPPVGALGDKWRPATSDIVIACTSDKRYWDDIATRRPGRGDSPYNKILPDGTRYSRGMKGRLGTDGEAGPSANGDNPAGAPLLDYWELPPGGYPGSHYAVYPPALVEPLIKAMAPPKVCQTCGEPQRRIREHLGRRRFKEPMTPEEFGVEMVVAMRRAHETAETLAEKMEVTPWMVRHWRGETKTPQLPSVERWQEMEWLPFDRWVIDALTIVDAEYETEDRGNRNIPERLSGGPKNGDKPKVVATGWSDCGHDNWRPAHILDCFAGSGTTLSVATGHGHEATGIDLDPRNRDLAYERIGPFLWSEA